MTHHKYTSSAGWIATNLLTLACVTSRNKNVFAAGDAFIDLSKDFELAPSYNLSPGAIAVNEAAAADPDIRTSLVLEDGKIVSSYARDDVDPEVPHQVWSTTKSWISLLTGIMLDEGHLTSLEETLGDIFPDESNWDGLSRLDAAFRKAVTVEELLTMSSGLVSPPRGSGVVQNPFDGGNAGGTSLRLSLAFPDIGAKGEFSYLATSNIMSYVIKEKTGKTPRQYLAEKVLPFLGIEDSDIDWWQNRDGMEYSYHGLELTPDQMAKFGQLYLARGVTGPDGNIIVSPEWIDASNSPQIESVPLRELLPELSVDAAYGYFFWSGKGIIRAGNRFQNKKENTVWCALGAGGQDICIDTSLGRVSVQQRDFVLGMGNGIMASVALDPALTFDVEDGAGGSDEATSTSGDKESNKDPNAPSGDEVEGIHVSASAEEVSNKDPYSPGGDEGGVTSASDRCGIFQGLTVSSAIAALVFL